jgi:CubicO group peptidase (beta-lactamase class C family)
MFLKRTLSMVLLALPLAAAALQVTKPEDVGLSSDRLKRINELIDRRIASGDISGAVTLVARRGRVAHFEAQGLANIDAKKPMSKDAIFRLASMSKPVTGVAIMMLVEEGKVRLTDPVSRYIPELRGLKVAVVQPARGAAAAAQSAPQFYTVPADREITIRDLLSHVSGLVSGPISTAEAAKVARKADETLADYIPRLGSVPLEFQPGSRWSYSPGAGFDTLGRVVEVVSGQNFDQFLRQRIFNPLEMKDIGFNPTPSMESRRATIYQKRDGRLQAAVNANTQPTPYFSGAGGLMSSTEDYLPLGQMLVNGGQLNGKRVLSPRTVEMMGSPHAPDSLPGRNPGQSFGLSVRLVSDHVKAVSPLSDGSFGWSGAQGTHFWVDPKEKIVAILMVQTSIPELQRDFEEAVMQAIIE